MTSAGLACDAVTRQGPAWSAIVHETAEAFYDLVIVNPVDRDRMERWLYGPSIYRILRDSATPVLAVPVDRPALHTNRLGPPGVTILAGLPVTTVPHTIADVAASGLAEEQILLAM